MGSQLDFLIYKIKILNFLKLLEDNYIHKILRYFLNNENYKYEKKDYPNYILGQMGARASSNKKLQLHRDTRVVNPNNAVLQIACFYYLTDTNINNGCTYIIPGSNNFKSSYNSDRAFENIKSLELQKR